MFNVAARHDIQNEIFLCDTVQCSYIYQLATFSSDNTRH